MLDQRRIRRSRDTSEHRCARDATRRSRPATARRAWAAHCIESAKSDYQAAEQSLRRAIELQTDHAEAHHNLANLLAAQRDYRQAAYEFQQAIAANPAYAEAHYRFGLLLLATGAIDRAQHEIEEAIRLKPGLTEAQHDLADILAAKKGRQP